MNIKFPEKVFRVIFIFVFVVGTVWVPKTNAGASSALAMGNGLYAEYRNLGGTEVILTIDGEGPINHGWNGSCPGTDMYQNVCGSWAGMFNSWSLLEETLTGYIEAPATGTYEFHSWIDDYLQITINGVTQTADDIGGAGYSIVMDLVEGQFYPVTMYYKNRAGSADVSLFWTKPDATFEVVPKQYLYTEIPNQIPVADSQNVTTDEGVAVNITLSGSDGDNDPLSYLVVDDPSNGELTGTAPNLIYTPNENYFGTDSFTFKVNDGMADSNAATVTINVLQGPELTLEKNASPTTYNQVGEVINYSYLLTNTGSGTLSGPLTVTDDKTTVVCPSASLGDTVLFDHYENSNLAQYIDGTPAYVDGSNGLGQAIDFSSGAWLRYNVPGWYQWTSDYDPTGKAGSVDLWIYPKQYNTGLVNFNWYESNTSPGSGYILHLGLNADGKLTGGSWSAISGPVLTQLTPGNTTIPINQWTHVAYTWGTDGTRLYVNGVQDAFSPDNLYPALNSTFYVYVPYWGYPGIGYLDELRITSSSQTNFGILNLAPTETTTCTADYTITQSDIDNGAVTNTAQAHGFFNATPVDSNQDTATVTLATNPISPSFEVWAARDEVDGWNWPPYSNIQVEIDDPSNGAGIDYITLLTSDGSGNFNLYLNGLFDIVAGQQFTVTSGFYTKSHELKHLVITNVNTNADTVYGTATPNLGVDAWFCLGENCEDRISRYVTADENGDWMADFSVAGPNPGEETPYNIVPGMLADATYHDVDGDMTRANWRAPNPNIEVTVSSLHIIGRGWNAGSVITLSIDGIANGTGIDYTDQVIMQPSHWNPDDIVANFELDQKFTFYPDDVITMTDGFVPMTYTVQAVDLTEINVQADTASGTGTPGDQLQVCVNEPSFCAIYRYVIVNSSGEWTADFSVPGIQPDEQEIVDILPGYNVRVIDQDEYGNRTCEFWSAPNPSFSARLTENQVHGYEWPLGSSVTLVIDDINTPQPVDYTDTLTVVLADWDPNQTFVRFDLGSFVLGAGQVVTMSQDGTIKTHTVTSLVVTAVDPVADTVSGTATSGTQIDIGHIYCDQNGCTGYRRVIADSNGNWIADFAHVGEDSDEQDIIDIKPGMGNEARQCDEDGECTTYGWYVPNPYVEASPNSNWVHAREWPTGTLMTLTIDDPSNGTGVDYTTTATMGQAPWNPGDPNDIVADFNLNGYDVKAGDIITASGNGQSKTMVVSQLVVTDFDKQADTVSGMGLAGAQIQVCANVPNRCIMRYVTINGLGNWMANYGAAGVPPDDTDTYDVQPGSNGWAAEYELDSDRTWVDWNVPNPSLGVRANDDNVEGWQWQLGATITVTVDDPESVPAPDITKTTVVYEAPWNPGEYRFDIGLSGEYDIQPGDIVTASDGTTTKTHTVTSLAFTHIDVDIDVVTGVAPAGSSVDIWTCDDTSCYNYDPDPIADGGGVWSVDFTNIFDIVVGTWVDSSQNDEDGDATYFGQNAPSYTIHAVPAHPEVHGHDWPKNANITLTIDDDTDPNNGILYTQTRNVSDNPWCGEPCFDLLGVFGLEVGQYASMTDGYITRTVHVSGLQVTEVNRDNNTISGVADPGSRVAVNIWSQNDLARYVTTDTNGNWTADFSVVGDEDFEQSTTTLRYGDNGRAIQLNPDGTDDGTLEYWHVLRPRPYYIKAGPTEDWVHARGWPAGATLTLTVDDPNTPQPVDYTATASTVPAPWDPGDPDDLVGIFELGGVFDLQAGNIVTITDGITSLNATVTDLTQIRWFESLQSFDAVRVAYEQTLVDEFNMTHPHIELLLESFSADGNSIFKNQVTAGNAPDIVGLTGWTTANEFHGSWLDLTSLIQSTNYDTSVFTDAALESYQTDEGQVALPFALYPTAVFYQRAMFDAAGLHYPPANYGDLYLWPDNTQTIWNFDTLTQVAKLLTLDANGRNATEIGFNRNNIVQYGYVPQWQGPKEIASYWKDDILYLGVPGNYTAMIPDEWASAWEWYYNGMWGAEPFIPTSLKINNSWGGNAFDSGKVAMLISHSWYTCCLGNAGSNWDLAPLPSYNGAIHNPIHADTFRIWNSTQHAPEAFEVLTYLIGADSQALLDAWSGGAAVSARTADQGAFLTSRNAAFPWVANWDVMLDGLPYIGDSNPEDYMPNFTEASNRLQTFGDRLSNQNGLDVNQEITTLQNDLTSIFNYGQTPNPVKDLLISDSGGKLWLLDPRTLNLLEYQQIGTGGNFDIIHGGPSEIYIANFGNARIERFNLETRELVVIANGSPLIHPIGLAKSLDGSVLYIADHAGKIFSLNLQTSAIELLADHGPNNEQFNSPDGIIVDANGNVIFADHSGHIYRINPNNKSVSIITLIPNAELNGMQFLNANELLIASQDSPPAVFRVNINTGAVTTFLEGAPFRNPEDVVVDHQNNLVYILDSDFKHTYADFRPGIYVYNIQAETLQSVYVGSPFGDIVDLLTIPTTQTAPFTLNIRAYIDGTSQLVVRGNTAYWHHIGADAPGRTGGHYDPTYINGTEWYPTWPDIPDERNRDCNCDSSMFIGFVPALPMNADYRLDLIQARYNAYISQQPSADNNYTLIIDFDDGPPGGGEWYEVELSVETFEPHPSFNVWLNQNKVDGYGWPRYSPVTLTVEDPATPASPDFTWTLNAGPTDWDASGTSVSFQMQDQFQLGAGQVVTLTSGSYIRTHTITNLVVSSISAETNLVTGTATAGSDIRIENKWDKNIWRHEVSAPDGSWTADFNIAGDETGEVIADLKPGEEFHVGQSDEDGDGTWWYLPLPNPSFSARLTENQVHGYGWPLGSSVTLTIDDPNTPQPIDYTNTLTVVVADWDPNQTFVQFELGSFVLGTGQVVTMSQDGTIKTHTVTSLVVKAVDPVADTVSGTAAPGTQVDIGHIYCDQNGCTGYRRVITDTNGNWIADFAHVGEDSDEQDIVDIKAGTGSEARQCDEDGECTTYGWNVPNPSIGVRANNDSIEGWEWTLGTTVTVTVDDPLTGPSPDITRTTVVYQPDWNPNERRFDISLSGEYDIKAGDIVTASDGVTTKTHTVTSLAFTNINIDTDVVTGVAPAGSLVFIWACDDMNCYDPAVVADGSGIWIADFTNVLDIVLGTWVDSKQTDEDGDVTYFGQSVPNTRINARLNENAVEAYEFQGGTNVSLQIDDPNTPEPVDYTASQYAYYTGNLYNTSLRFDLSGFTLASGQTITITDGVTTKTLTVATLDVTSWNVAADTISGNASPSADIWSDLWTDSATLTRHFAAGGDGNWTADYSVFGDEDFEQSKYDIVNGTSGEVRIDDADGDATTVTWTVYTPWIAPSSVPFVVGITRDVKLNQPQYYLEDWSVLNLLYEPLYRVGQDSTLIPAAATGYTISTDSKLFTFTLRNDMLWSDGQPVTAQHYVDGLLWLLDPATSPTDYGNAYASLLYDIEGAEAFHQGQTTDPNTVGITALNSTTLQITLVRPAVHLPHVLSIPGMIPVRKDLITLYGSAWVEPANLVGNGPFKLDEHDGTHFLFSKNAYYYNADHVSFVQLAMPIIPDANEQFEAYKNGTIDAVINAPQTALDDANYTPERIYSAQPGFFAIGLNTKDAPTDNLLVRKALASAIDRRALLDNVFKTPWRQTATGIIPPEIPGYQGNAVGFEYNPTLAQSLLAQAGYPGGVGLPTVHLYGFPTNQAQLDAIAEQWRTVLGITVETHYRPDYISWMNTECTNNLATCDSSGLRLGWIVDYYDAFNIIGDWSNIVMTRTGWDSIRYRELMDLIRAEQDPAQRIAYIQEAEQILVEEDAAVIPLYFNDRVSLVKPGFTTSFGIVPYFQQWNMPLTLLAPKGTLTSWNNTFTWTGLTGADWYLVQVQAADDTVILQKWTTADAAGCSGDLSCVINPDETLNLTNGDYKWRILDYGGYGYGNWTPYATFNLNAACYILTTNVLPASSGTVTASSQNCSGGYLAGTEVQLTAVANSGYGFTSWSGDVVETSNPVFVTMNTDKNITANFTALGATLISPAGALTSWDNTFSWTGITGASWYLVQVQAVDDTVILQQWYTADAAGCSGDLSCVINPDETLNFTNGDYKWRILDYGDSGYGNWSAFTSFNLNAACYILTTNILPPGSGMLNVSTQNCSGGYTAGTLVHLSAIPQDGYIFTHWSGDITGTLNPISFTMDADKSITTNFTTLGATLLDPHGTLTSWNNTFTWTGLTGAEWYLVQAQTADSAVILQHWYTAEAAGCSAGTTCSVTPFETLNLPNGDYKWRVLDYGSYGYGNWSAYTSFNLNAACYALTTGVLPADSGTLTASTQNCTGGYLAGTVVQLSANQNSGYAFTSWSGDVVSTANPVSFTMDADKTVTAHFAALGATLLDPHGPLTSWNNTFTWTGLTGAEWYLVQVQDMADNNILTKWYTAEQVNCAGDLSCTISPDETLTLSNGYYKWHVLDYGSYGYGSWSPYMNFTLSLACYTLTTNILPEGGGTVTASAPNCLVTLDPPTTGYFAGTVVQLTAVPSDGYLFQDWSGDAGGTATPLTITMDADKNVTANFKLTVLPISPAGDQWGIWNQTFTWRGLPDATWYLIEVQMSDGTPVFVRWYTSEQTACSGGTACSVVVSELNLAEGGYKWRILDYGAYGYGNWTPFKNFTINYGLP